MSCSNTETEKKIPAWIIAEAEKIVHRGNTVEIKKEHGKFVIVEIKRKLIKENLIF